MTQESEHQRVPDASSDPTVIRSIVVTSGDVVAAVEMRQTSSKTAVLRITPPFSGRMRARLHVRQGVGAVQSGDASPVHVDPDGLVADPPSYPRPNDTADELRADPSLAYTVERHREYHADAVEAWRDAVADSIRDRVELETAAGPHAVTVRTLEREL